MKVLVLNSGSSSQKSALYELGDTLPVDPSQPIWHAEIEWGTSKSLLRVQTDGATVREEQVSVRDRKGAIEHMLESLWSGRNTVVVNRSDIDVVGHRVVHGGSKFHEPTLVTPEVKKAIAELAAFAPLHNRAELEGIETVERLMDGVPQVTVFDTGFHHSMPLVATVYPGPYQWFEQGICRYGFHGINYQYCSERAAELLNSDLRPLRLICCHLGNGCSVVAIGNGHSVDTTMGFTPLEGLMMGTRSGSVDPGILTYLMQQQGISGEELDLLLNKKSGLLGISGISGDMREVLAGARAGQERAKLAFEIFIDRLAKGIAEMSVSLAGMDALVFTGGIGEHSPEVRKATCDKLKFLGVELNSESNNGTRGDRMISSARSGAAVLVIQAQEDWTIAKACVRLVRGIVPARALDPYQSEEGY